MRHFFSAILLAVLLASCAPQPAPVPTSIPSPTVIAHHAHEIRFALIGEPRKVNVWELFDESGASYVDYALRSEYWPRLYHLVPPDLTFQPLAADGMPSKVIQEGNQYSATVNLRTDLKWTDGSPFTAEDVAFTVNTALAFELGFDWSAYYSRETIDRAEVIDPSTVKFHFKQKPNAGVWQYGALQGVIVQKAFWEPLIKAASGLLPDDALRAQIADARTYLGTVQSEVNDLAAQVNALKFSGGQNRDLETNYSKKQDELIYAQNNLDGLLEEYAAKIKSAHQALYAIDDKGEPLLGVWIPAEKKDGAWVNEANPDFPFEKPNFDRALYYVFKDENAAVAAFQKGDVDFILSPNGVSKDVAGAKPVPTYHARFLVVNPLRVQAMDSSFRLALSCMLDRNALANDVLQGHAFPLDSFVLSPQWHNPDVKDACAGMDRPARIANTVKILKDAGYSWTQEPDAKLAGQNLTMPNGEPFAKVTLITPSKEDDPLRFTAAKYIAEQAQYLGIHFAVQEMSLNDVMYAVFSSQKYDMALVGWRLSEYPAYLCEWFGGTDLHLYNGGRYQSACEAMSGESDLEASRRISYQFETALMGEMPFIPLFRVARFDAIQGLSYPISAWNSSYGAPSYAMPSP